MTPALLVLLSLPCVYWTQGIESRAALEAAGVKRICVAPEQVETWRAAGFPASPLTVQELASRDALPTPGTTARAGQASPTRSPWIVASGWRFTRSPGRNTRTTFRPEKPRSRRLKRSRTGRMRS